MGIGETIQSFQGILHMILDGARNVLTSIFGIFPYDKLLIMYLALLVVSLILSYLFFKKVITFSPISGKYFWWLLLLALLIFSLLAFI